MTHFCVTKLFSSKLPQSLLYNYDTRYRDSQNLRFVILKRSLMLKFLSSMSRTSKTHPFFMWELLNNFTYHWELDDNQAYQCRMNMVQGWSGLLHGMLPCTWVIQYHQYLNVERHASLLSSFLLDNSLYCGVNGIISSQKLVGRKLDKMIVASLGRQPPQIFNLLFQEFLRIFVWSYKVLFPTICIA